MDIEFNIELPAGDVDDWNNWEERCFRLELNYTPYKPANWHGPEDPAEFEVLSVEEEINGKWEATDLEDEDLVRLVGLAEDLNEKEADEWFSSKIIEIAEDQLLKEADEGYRY